MAITDGTTVKKVNQAPQTSDASVVLDNNGASGVKMQPEDSYKKTNEIKPNNQEVPQVNSDVKSVATIQKEQRISDAQKAQKVTGKDQEEQKDINNAKIKQVKQAKEIHVTPEEYAKMQENERLAGVYGVKKEGKPETIGKKTVSPDVKTTEQNLAKTIVSDIDNKMGVDSRSNIGVQDVFDLQKGEIHPRDYGKYDFSDNETAQNLFSKVNKLYSSGKYDEKSHANALKSISEALANKEIDSADAVKLVKYIKYANSDTQKAQENKKLDLSEVTEDSFSSNKAKNIYKDIIGSAGIRDLVKLEGGINSGKYKLGISDSALLKRLVGNKIRSSIDESRKNYYNTLNWIESQGKEKEYPQEFIASIEDKLKDKSDYGIEQKPKDMIKSEYEKYAQDNKISTKNSIQDWLNDENETIQYPDYYVDRVRQILNSGEYKKLGGDISTILSKVDDEFDNLFAKEKVQRKKQAKDNANKALNLVKNSVSLPKEFYGLLLGQIKMMNGELKSDPMEFINNMYNAYKKYKRLHPFRAILPGEINIDKGE